MRPKWVGLLFIILGVLWLLNNLGFTHIGIGELISVYWPVGLIIWGIEAFVPRTGSRSSNGSILNGLLLLGFGVAILGRNLGFYDLDFSLVWKVIWPLAIIFVGWNILKGTLRSSGGTNFAVMSGIDLKKEGWKLESGSFFAFMGGVDMDITVADVPEQVVSLDLIAVMGGIDIRAPRDFTIECHGTALLGGVGFLGEESGGIFASKKFEHKGSADSGKKLIIKGTAIMGGINIKY